MPKILIVDDNLAFRDYIGYILSLAGHQTLQAGDGQQALQLLQDQVPDLIVCDVVMPELDGYSLLERLKADTRWANIPFLFVSAKADSQALRRGMSLGADDYLTKPFSAQELNQAIEINLAKRRRWQAEAEQQMATLRRNISTAIPHELIAPLNNLTSYSQLLADPEFPMEWSEVNQVAQVLKNNVNRINHLIRNYLLYASLQLLQNDPQQRQALQNHHFEVEHHWLTHQLISCALQRKRRDDLHLQLNTRPITLSIAEESLAVLLEELFDNACKFSQPGSPIHLQSRLTSSHWELSIHNFGRGMHPDEIAAMGAYCQFQRDLYEQQGVGLGLEIVGLLLKLHDGTWHIDSKPGEEMNVRLELPLKAIEGRAVD